MQKTRPKTRRNVPQAMKLGASPNGLGRSFRRSEGPHTNYSTPYKVIALKDFPGYHNDQLSFKKDEVITVTKTNPSGWYEGENSKHVKGSFPFNLVESIANLRPKNVKRSYRKRKKEKKEKEKAEKQKSLGESSMFLGKNLFGSGYLFNTIEPQEKETEGDATAVNNQPSEELQSRATPKISKRRSSAEKTRAPSFKFVSSFTWKTFRRGKSEKQDTKQEESSLDLFPLSSSNYKNTVERNDARNNFLKKDLKDIQSMV
eukprot:augustus_masked-scaffold_1-processed-gene-27.9-mRNA-1 protein AED:1.00 eAED:1.00 QI:0/-1/0/0/-1/1/1/0/258